MTQVQRHTTLVAPLNIEAENCVSGYRLLYFVPKCNVLYREYVLCACDDVLANERLICRFESSAFRYETKKNAVVTTPFFDSKVAYKILCEERTVKE